MFKLLNEMGPPFHDSFLTIHLCLFNELTTKVQEPCHRGLGFLRHDVLHALIHRPGKPSSTSDLRTLTVDLVGKGLL